jgi:hypothetical protein
MISTSLQHLKPLIGAKHATIFLCSQACHVPNPCNCEILVEIVLLNCMHTQNIPCSADEKDFDCVETVTKIMPVCGHKQRMMCHMDPKDLKCMTSVVY